MIEADWLTCPDSRAMLDFLRGKASDRKQRLFACACCRLVWGSLLPRSQRAVEVAEKYADGLATEQDLHRARSQACELAAVVEVVRVHCPCLPHRWRLAGNTAYSHEPFLIGRVCWHPGDDDLDAGGPPLLRDIFNPWPFSRLSPQVLAWDAGTVVRLAQAAYDDRLLPSGHLDTGRLSVLADALTDAACTDAQLIDHLRSPEPHVRGCWAVDLLVAKE